MTQFDEIYAEEAIAGLLDLYGQPLRYLTYDGNTVDTTGILTRQSEYEAGANHEAINEIATVDVPKSAVSQVHISDDYVEFADQTRWLVLAVTAEEGGMWTLRIERITTGPAWGGRRY